MSTLFQMTVDCSYRLWGCGELSVICARLHSAYNLERAVPPSYPRAEADVGLGAWPVPLPPCRGCPPMREGRCVESCPFDGRRSIFSPGPALFLNRPSFPSTTSLQETHRLSKSLDAVPLIVSVGLHGLIYSSTTRYFKVGTLAVLELVRILDPFLIFLRIFNPNFPQLLPYRIILVRTYRLLRTLSKSSSIYKASSEIL